MAVGDIVPVPGDSFEQTLTAASPDLLREMIRAFAQKMMDAEVEVGTAAGRSGRWPLASCGLSSPSTAGASR